MADRIERVLVVTAHPDDAEFGAGGTVARLAKEGRQVAYCIATNGNKGTSDRALAPERLARIREEEQRNAARVLGVEAVEFLGFDDGELEDTRASRMAVCAAVRRHRPDLIITQNPHRTRNLFASHRDHRITGGIVLDVVYPLARDHLAFPELLAQGLEPHRVREVHLMAWDEPDLAVDIADTLDLKLRALACHASQIRDMEAVGRRVRDRAAQLGRPHGHAYAETFQRIVIDR